MKPAVALFVFPDAYVSDQPVCGFMKYIVSDREFLRIRFFRKLPGDHEFV